VRLDSGQLARIAISGASCPYQSRRTSRTTLVIDARVNFRVDAAASKRVEESPNNGYTRSSGSSWKSRSRPAVRLIGRCESYDSVSILLPNTRRCRKSSSRLRKLPCSPRKPTSGIPFPKLISAKPTKIAGRISDVMPFMTVRARAGTSRGGGTDELEQLRRFSCRTTVVILISCDSATVFAARQLGFAGLFVQSQQLSQGRFDADLASSAGLPTGRKLHRTNVEFLPPD